MPTLIQHRRLTSLIVFIAILLNLCVPAIGQAMTAWTADPLASEICSAAPPAGERQQPAGHAIKHCVFCATHINGEAPPPAPAGLLSTLDGHDVYPQWQRAAPAPALTWSDAQPRGPPAA